MVGELVIHLGDCKTGTTSIQAALAKRLWRAEGQDIAYNVPFNHIPLAKSLTEGGLERIRRCQREALGLGNSDAPFGVISAEHFEFVDPLRLREAIDEFFPQYRSHLRLVAYVRPHIDRILSTYAERTKKGEIDLDIDEFARVVIRRGRFVYHQRFAKWRALFGTRFTLRPFIRSEMADGDVVADFFTYLFRGAPFSLPADQTQNQSLSVEDLVMMRHIQRQMTARGGIDDAQRAFGWNFSEILGAAPQPEDSKGTRLRMHRRLAEKLIEHYRQDAEIIDRDHFSDRDRPMTRALEGSLSAAVAKPMSTEPTDYHDPAALRLMDCWGDFMIRMATADQRAYLKMASSPEYRVEPVTGPLVAGPGAEGRPADLAAMSMSDTPERETSERDTPRAALPAPALSESVASGSATRAPAVSAPVASPLGGGPSLARRSRVMITTGALTLRGIARRMLSRLRQSRG